MADTRFTTLDFPQPGIARLSLHHPDHSLNILSQAMLGEIAGHLDALADRTDLMGLVIVSGKPAGFIAGADLKEFAASIDEPAEVIRQFSRHGQLLLQRLSKLKMVTVVAIDGICVGGGTELSVWCDRRVVTDNPKTQIGFPEVKLGLFPGWGGTARTPRIVGLANAVEMVTSGKNVSGAEAFAMGLADDIVSASGDVASKLMEAAVRVVMADQASGEYLANREKWASEIPINEAELAFLGATALGVIQQETKGHYPAPLVALEVLLEGALLDIDAACELESERFTPLFGSPVNRGLLNVFFLTDFNKDGIGSDKKQLAANSVGVAGAGTMGQGIAAVSLRRGVRVSLADNRAEALLAAEKAVLSEAAFDRETKSASTDKVLELTPELDMTPHVTDLAACDLVVEAVVENLEIKQQLLQQIEAAAGDETILCSNTSTIPISLLAKGLTHPERFCGLHFFNPVRKMPLVEVIRGSESSPATIERAAAFARKLGKSPVVVNDGPGFLVNRLLLPYMNEAAVLLTEKVPLKAIESAAKEFGMPMGPIELHDVIGLDVCLHAGRVLRDAFSDRVIDTPMVDKLVSNDRLGQKNGRGFYDWQKDKKGRWKKQPSDVVSEFVAALATDTEPPGDLVDRLMLPMLVEATRALEEGIAADVRDIDLALIFGIGFPPFRGGLFFWADTVGAAAIVEKLAHFHTLGKRYEVTKLLEQKARDGSKFYE
ncbi:3-hydroxyacyl-CoA dehydrogenase NAD-binding domain-containing protein [Aeoliella mucimassa]|uniref:Fatty acid oxidation complex subunit alpha n=1 Tax=Aeoliella mucimassa TaxID=2527972 RepID=A0A518AVN9_9BACT|nr:3-hydroxyacyl-CoA dehydrogenase NAD-binding domain-containing protein [Aeoliella mucimassa]QDU58771.1 Fatty acid oxidation complex subunit alpha [Aeoliella mucimassa]